MRRELATMPHDRHFYNSAGELVSCHATGYEVCKGDPGNPADWWDEFEDGDGELYYGR